MTNKEIGAWIKAKRLEKGFSQKGLAMRLGLSAPAVAHFESGLRRVPVEILLKIAKILDVTLEGLK